MREIFDSFAGFDDFLHKPINPSDLLDAVRRLCG